MITCRHGTVGLVRTIRESVSCVQRLRVNEVCAQSRGRAAQVLAHYKRALDKTTIAGADREDLHMRLCSNEHVMAGSQGAEARSDSSIAASERPSAIPQRTRFNTDQAHHDTIPA